MKDLNKFRWCMFWWAIGDAFWAPVEFCWVWHFEPVDVVNWRIWLMKYWKDFWDWTDDTAMSNLLAESLIRCWKFDIEDQIENYYKWHKTWYLWLKPYPEWEWLQVNKMMFFYEQYKAWLISDKPWETDLSWEYMDWNGSLMRIGSIALYYFDDAEKALFYAWESSKSTHHTDLCIDSCIYYTGLIWWALHWVKKEELLKPFYSPVEEYRERRDIARPVWLVVDGLYKEKTSNDIKPSWYVVESLEVALRGFYHSNSFEEWLKMIVDLWWDADTTACIYWYLAWAYYWYDAISDYLKEWLAAKDFIENITQGLYTYKYKKYEWEIKPIVVWDHETRLWSDVLNEY